MVLAELAPPVNTLSHQHAELARRVLEVGEGPALARRPRVPTRQSTNSGARLGSGSRQPASQWPFFAGRPSRMSWRRRVALAEVALPWRRCAPHRIKSVQMGSLMWQQQSLESQIHKRVGSKLGTVELHDESRAAQTAVGLMVWSRGTLKLGLAQSQWGRNCVRGAPEPVAADGRLPTRAL
eukprot:15471391-Alexandrium_andersonii.AAC.2